MAYDDGYNGWGPPVVDRRAGAMLDDIHRQYERDGEKWLYRRGDAGPAYRLDEAEMRFAVDREFDRRGGDVESILGPLVLLLLLGALLVGLSGDWILLFWMVPWFAPLI
ncbi:hypothetical protein [Sphingomicrobium aestuariivivum]|uniref:hypothetical protein n=1 Tax=Sphingomicrobium aestuariivivum TaxID=1582356 RepID=UPI001FD69899|nr:hypothetical protein [Sphingomicrobium aestuariivivum]MCJ8190350.1 hypothetical protein [Sphingomicrobium aestuariivivum]